MPAQLIKASSLFLFSCSNILLIGCASDLTPLRTTSSPDGHGTASIVMDGPGLLTNQVIRMEVFSNGKRHIVFETEPQGDLDECFVAIGWSSDSSQVGLLLRPCYANSSIIKGYDCGQNSSIPTEQAKDLLREAIRLQFSFKPGIYNDPYLPPRTFISDPLFWAERTDDAVIRYAKLRKNGHPAGGR